MQAVPNCKHAYLQKVDAIAKNGSGVGVEHASDEAIKAALGNLVTPKEAVIEEIETQFLFDFGLIGHPNSAKIRQKLSDVLGIGYVNGKQLQKRLMMFGITKQQVVDVLTDSN